MGYIMMARRFFAVLVLFFCGTVFASLNDVIPKPGMMKTSSGFFQLTKDTKILYGEGCQVEAGKLESYLEPAMGFDLELRSMISNTANSVMLRIDPTLAGLGSEGYRLVIIRQGVEITSSTNAGIFYGIQTLRQLLPVEIFSDKIEAADWKVPCVLIEDSPTYPWRGMMLDVSRYFFDSTYVKRYMEIMAMHKLNILHLHLVDDPGWRLQIDKYPELTNVGAFRGKGAQRYGGYYTKDEIRDIVKYAAKLHIEIIPEIELPAHCQSALSAYPWLGCSDKVLEVPTTCYITPEILCAGKESTYTFLKDVLTEVAELFPGRFIHIGGDEVKIDRWKSCKNCNEKLKALGLTDHRQLQTYMIREIEKFLMTKNRRLLGWDEILSNGLAPNSTVMTWHRPETAVQAAKNGNNVVMALTGHAYFDTPESKLPGEPPAATWLAPISLQKAYQWEPAPSSLNDREKKFILGAHGCIWTDRFMHNPILQDLGALDENRSFNYVEYLSLPRMAAMAEVVWTKQGDRKWEDFATRQLVQYNRYTAAGYHYRVPLPIVDKTPKASGKFEVTMTSPVNGAAMHYTTDGTYPTAYSKVYTNPIVIDDLDKFSAITAVSTRHYSLAFNFPQDKSKQFAKFGDVLGKWQSGKVSAGTFKPLDMDATGKIDGNGTYEVTFMYTHGIERLDIEKVEIVVNGKVVADDKHPGTTGGRHKDNTYRLKITNFETGANYTVRANVMGDTGSDSNGVVLIKRMQ